MTFRLERKGPLSYRLQCQQKIISHVFSLFSINQCLKKYVLGSFPGDKVDKAFLCRVFSFVGEEGGYV